MIRKSRDLEEAIIREEVTSIHVRRKMAFGEGRKSTAPLAGAAEHPAPESPEPGVPERPCNDLDGGAVGLAISGGGIRSGSTALGLLQSLYRNGLLRHVDYLSSVSGGTYAAALISSQIATRDSANPIDFTPLSHQPGEVDRRLPIFVERNEPQPPAIQALALTGENLKSPIRFLTRHLWGLLTVNAFLASGAIALAALAALIIRLCDLPKVSIHLAELGFQTDLARAYFPATLAFLAWLLSAGITGMLGRRLAKLPPISSWAYVALLVTAILGTITLFSTANLNLEAYEIWAQKDSGFGNKFRSLLGWMGQILAVTLAIAVTPLLSLKDLLRSGTSTNRMERWIFNVASSAILLGIPLVLFYFLSAEDISGTVTGVKSNPVFSRGHIRLADSFLDGLERTARTSRVAGGASAVSTSDPLLEEQKSKKNPFSAWLTAAVGPWRGNAAQRSSAIIETYRRQIDSLILAGLRESEWGRDAQAPARPTEGEEQAPREQAVTDAKLAKLREIRTRSKELAAVTGLSSWFPFSVPRYLFGSQTARNITDRENYQEGLDALATVIREKVIGNRDLVQNLKLASTNSAQFTSPEDEASDDLRRLPLDRPIPEDLITPANQEFLLARLIDRADKLPPRDDQALRTNAQKAPPSSEAATGRDKTREQINWNIMRVVYGPQLVYPSTEIFAAVVAEKDCQSRFWVFGIALLTFLLLGCVSVNTTTMHGFYRDQLASAWIDPHANARRHIPLCDVQTTTRGGPLLIVNATVNLRGAQGPRVGNRTERFILTPDHIGCERLGFVRTRRYLEGDYQLDDATALSGSAVSPMASSNVLARALLVVLNFRLGQWLPNPSPTVNWHSWSIPSAHKLLAEHFRIPPDHRSFLFVSDGGHHENTGIESLLVRRCRVIIAADFSEDQHSDFSDFRRLCLMADEQLGVTITEHSRFPLSNLRPSTATHLVQSHFALMHIQYPSEGFAPGVPTQGWLILIKPGLSGDEPVGLRECRRNFSHFPHDPTGDQMFEEARFMAYRQLGEHLGDSLFEFFETEGVAPGLATQCDDPLWLSQLWEPRTVDPPANPPAPLASPTSPQKEVVAKTESPRAKPR